MKKVDNMVIVGFVLNILLGITLILARLDSLVQINFFFVSIFALAGVLGIINFITSKEKKKRNYFSLIFGIYSIWLACLAYVYYSLFIIAMPIIFSLYALLVMTFIIIKCIEKRTIGRIITSILSLVISILLIFRPILAVNYYFKIIGIYLIIVPIVIIMEEKKVFSKK